MPSTAVCDRAGEWSGWSGAKVTAVGVELVIQKLEQLRLTPR